MAPAVAQCACKNNRIARAVLVLCIGFTCDFAMVPPTVLYTIIKREQRTFDSYQTRYDILSRTEDIAPIEKHVIWSIKVDNGR